MSRTWFTFGAALAVCAALLVGSMSVQAQQVAGPSQAANSLAFVNPSRGVNTVPGTISGVPPFKRERFSPSAANRTAYPDYAEGVQYKDGNPSPAGSNIGNYIFQDEQININPNDGTVKVLRADQKNLIQDYVQRVIPVQHVDTIEIVSALQTVTAKEGGWAETIRDYTKHKYAIQVIAPAWLLPHLEKAVKALDEEWVSEFNDGSVDLYYKTKNRDPVLVNRIASAFGDGTVETSVIDGTNSAILRQGEQYWVDRFLTGAKLCDVPEHQINLEGAIYELNLGNDLKLGLDYIAWKNGPGRNLFDFLLAGEHNREHFRNASSVFNPDLTHVGLFAGRDIPIGVIADVISDQLGASFGKETYGYEQESAQQYYAANFLLTAAYFDFLQSKGKAKIMARPRITTRSGTVGTWSSVDQILSFEAADIINPNAPIIDSNLTTNPGFEGTTPDLVRDQFGNLMFGDIGEILPSLDLGPPTVLSDRGMHVGDVGLLNGWGDTNVSPRVLRYRNSGQTGIFLSILPMIGLETTELTIDFAASDLNGYTPQGTPIINTRTYATTVRVADGQTFVVGGIRRTEKVQMKQGMPGLSKLPVLGWLFGGETKVDHQSDVALVLTPDVYVGAESDMALPTEAATVIAQATGEAASPLPKNPFGFDQWMLDSEK